MVRKHDYPSDKCVLLPDGRRLGYADYGALSGQPIFSFHGGLSSRLDVRFADDLCRSLGVRLISVDRPGIGLSDYQPGRTLLDWPDDVIHLADLLKLERFGLFGWSGGGPYVLACAYKIPHRVTRAGSSGGMAPLDRPGAVSELGLVADRILFSLVRRAPCLALALLELARCQMPAMLKCSLLRELSSPGDRAVILSLSLEETTEFFFEAFRSGADGTLQDYRIMGGPWGFRLEEISMEILLWQGEEDRLLPMTHAKHLAAYLPRGQLIVVPQQGHFLLRTQMPAIVTELTRTL